MPPGSASRSYRSKGKEPQSRLGNISEFLETVAAMKNLVVIAIAVVLVSTTQVRADMYTPPEQQREIARHFLDRKLSEIPEQDRAKYVRSRLQEIYRQKAEDEKNGKMKVRVRRDSHFGEQVDPEELALKEWLAKNESGTEQEVDLKQNLDLKAVAIKSIPTLLIGLAILVGLRRYLRARDSLG